VCFSFLDHFVYFVLLFVRPSALIVEPALRAKGIASPE
jgi:hypothetical protein